MNNKFYDLSEEKKLQIINAGLEVFAKNEYKKASTEEIAVKASISKGLLFYYFHNKMSFYLFLFEYGECLIRESISKSDYSEITDFFELLHYITRCKCQLMSDSPYILQFIVSAYCSNDELIYKKINKSVKNTSDNLMAVHFKNIDFSKFKDSINPKDIIEMLSYLLDGYLQEKLRTNEELDINEIMQKYMLWTELLKQSAYK